MGQAISFHFKPEERLRAALRSLEAALAEQREAVAEFRSNLGSLGESVSGLGGSLGDYRHRLGATLEEVEGVRHEALRLERTADGWLGR